MVSRSAEIAFVFILLGTKRDSPSISPVKSTSGPEATPSVPKKVAPPPGFKPSPDTKDGNVEVKPAIEPPPGFKGEAPEAKKGKKRRAEETDEDRAKRLKGMCRCFSIYAMYRDS